MEEAILAFLGDAIDDRKMGCNYGQAQALASARKAAERLAGITANEEKF